MSKRLFMRTLALQMVLTLVAAGTAFVVWNGDTALAVAAAGVVSALDLLVMGLAVNRLASARLRSRAFYAVALGLKFPVLIGVVYLLVAVWQLNTLGLLVGFATLVVAILYASVSYQRGLAQGEEG